MTDAGRRGAGWDSCTWPVDAYPLAYAEVLGDESQETSAAFLRRALAWFARSGSRCDGS